MEAQRFFESTNGKMWMRRSSLPYAERMYSTASPYTTSSGEKHVLFLGGIGYADTVLPNAWIVTNPSRLVDTKTFGDAESLNDDDIEIVLPATNGVLPDDIAQHTAVSYGAKVYIIGNYSAEEWNIICFDGDTQTFEEITLANNNTKLPTNLHCHSSALVETPEGPVIYSFGGAQYKESTQNLYAFDIKRRTWNKVTASNGITPPRRLYHMSCAVGQKVFIFGGAPDVKSTTADDPVYDDMWCFDTETQAWSRVKQEGQIPSRRGSSTLLYVAPYVYIIGGFDGQQCLDSIHRFDPVSNWWVDVSGEMKLESESPGETNTFDCSSASSTPCTNTFASSAMPSTPSCRLDGRWAFASFVLDGNICTVGGFGDRSTARSEMELSTQIDVFEPPAYNSLKHLLARFASRLPQSCLLQS